MENLSIHNNTHATTATRQSQPSSTGDTLMVIKLSMMLLIAAIGTVSNTVVLFVLTKKKNRAKISTILLLNLAVCDLLVSSVCISLDVTELVYQNWVFGNELCRVIYPFQTSLPIVSSYTFLFMLYERNLLFSKRVRTKLRVQTIRIFAVITWLLPFLVVLPYGLKLHVTTTGTQTSCVENWPKESNSKIYTVALTVIEYVFPMLFIIILTVKIYGYLRREISLVREGTLGLQKCTRIRRIKRNKRLTMTFMVMVGTYAIMKLPNNIFWQWITFGNGGSSEFFAEIRVFVGLLAYSTCATNPVILLWMSSELRKDIKNIFSKSRSSRSELETAL